MKILIAGYGFVGRAQELILKDHYEIVIHDPALGYNAHMQQIDAVVVCVSTPPRPDGSCEMKNVFEVCEQVNDNIPILVKSTISVEGWDFLQDVYPNQMICFSPEFLRAEHWEEDAFAKNMYLGGNCTQFWSTVYSKTQNDIEITIRDPRELIAAKVFRNSFLATKVAFFNQVWEYCKSYDLDYEDVRNTIAEDSRIGFSHSAITKDRGFGGHCFPKDMQAIKKSAQRNNVRLTIIEEAIEYNSTIRRND